MVPALRTLLAALLGAAFLFPALSVPRAGAAAAPTSWRVVAGEHAVRDALGQRWAADRGRARGGRLVTVARGGVGRTASPRLYRTARVGIRAWRLPLGAPGTYAVTLRLMEPGSRARAREGRDVFDIDAEGAPVARAVDVARMVGGRAAWPLVFRVVVTDGTLDLGFRALRGRAVASAVAVRRLSAATAPPAPAWGDEFDDTFDAPAHDDRWDYYVGVGHPAGWGAGELQTYTYRERNVAQDGAGHLAITARRETYTGRDGHRRAFTSGRIGTDGRFAFTYGSLTARLKMPAGKGIWPAFWLLGDDVDRVGWPAAGEIDVAEVAGSDPGRVFGSLHGPRPAGDKAYNINRSWRTPTPVDGDFHDYGVLRLPRAIQITYDGQPTTAYTPEDLGPGRPWVYDRPYRLMLNLAVGGIWDGAPDATTPFPATLLVDWVRLTT